MSRGGTDDDWRGLLVTAARRPECLSREDGVALATWGASRGERWRGARAEWLVSIGERDAATVLLASPGHDDARLRVAMATGDGTHLREAAEGALLLDARDVLACRTVAAGDLAAGDLLGALEASECGGVTVPELLRLRGEALDRAGRHDEAVAALRAGGANVHAAAVLYQEGATPDRWAEATRLLADPSPPARLHRVWMALLDGGTPVVDGLDTRGEATLARALADLGAADDALVARIEALERTDRGPHDSLPPPDPVRSAAHVVRARIAIARGDVGRAEAALSLAVAEDPAAEPIHRARIGMLRARGDVAAALTAWADQDADHVRLRGERGPRDLPWAAVVPWGWDEICDRDSRCGPGGPAGRDAVGEGWRAASDDPDAGKAIDGMAALLLAHPELERVPAERFSRAAPPFPSATSP